MKKETHPEWYPNAEVVCEGEVVMHVGSTQPRIVVDIWSGIHPFYTGEARLVDTEGQVDRFMRRLQSRQEIAKQREDAVVKKDPRTFEAGSMGIDSRALAALNEAGHTTVGDVLTVLEDGGEDALLAIAGIGQKALIDIRKFLRGEGLIE